MTASGFAGLGYQIVWTQQCALWLGHETAAVLAVVAAFFSGHALGSLASTARLECRPRPVLAYALCEMVIGLWAAALLALMSPLSHALLLLVGAEPSPGWQWTVYFTGTTVLLLPGTAAMGATLPLMERIFIGIRGGTRSVAALYAANTLGAVGGVLAGAFWLVPTAGLRSTAWLCVAVNLLSAVVALAVFHNPQPDKNPPFPLPRARRSMGGSAVRLAATGLLGIGYEVVVVRVLSEVTENSVYTYAALLAVYLGGTPAGAALYRRACRYRSAVGASGTLLCSLAVACALSGMALWAAERVHEVVRAWLGAGIHGAIGAESALALMAFAAPTMLMGALFSHLCARAADDGLCFGRALATNTLGAALAPVLIGVVGFPALGPKALLLLIACGYAVLAAHEAAIRRWLIVPATLAVNMALALPPLAFIQIPAGGRVVSYREGTAASISVVEDASGVAVLRINNRQQEGSSATLHVDGRQGWLPILLHPNPHRVLFLGLGTGLTSAAAAMDPTIKVDAVELLPEVIDAAKLFREMFARQLVGPVRTVAADARRYVRADGPRYDVIVADNFHPARSGSGALYTVEHFTAVRERLAPGGLFCQWLPLHQLDLDTLRSIVRSFVQVYPAAVALLASNSLQTPVIGLIGRGGVGAFDLQSLRTRLRSQQLRADDFGIEDDLALLGNVVAGPSALRRFSSNAPLNTDDQPVVMYRAPRITYAPDSTPAQRLLEFVGQVSIAPSEIVHADADGAWVQRLAAYWRARDLFLAAGRDVQAGGDVKDLLAEVRAPLFHVLQVSPDFRPAYDPLLRMAVALERTDRDAARRLLAQLAHVQPERGEAPRLLTSLSR